MPAKLKQHDVKIGDVREATFFLNPIRESGYRLRATHLDGKRAPKVVLSNDARIRPGIPCVVRVKKISKADRPDRGVIEVEFVRGAEIALDDVYVPALVARKLQAMLESDHNILLDGPAGSGKTVLSRATAQALGWHYVFFNCASIDDGSQFLATLQVQAGPDGQPVTSFLKTDVLLAFERAAESPEERFLVFLDELNRCNEVARNLWMSALDATRKIFNPVTGRMLEIPDNVLFIAAVNRGSEYTGTFGIDPAQLDRFAPIQLTYPPVDQEVQLLSKRHPEVARSIVEMVVSLANQIRESPDVSSPLSVRATNEALVYLKHDFFQDQPRRWLGEVLQSSFCGRFAGRWDDPMSEAGAVWLMIDRALSDAAKESEDGGR